MDDDTRSVPTAEEVTSALERIIASSSLAAGSRRATFLRYIVHEALAGRSERLKGIAIAIDVFGRGPEFDPLTDSIVRTEARRVRQALDSYYAGAGYDDPIRIFVPKGTYVPKFERRWTGGLEKIDTEASQGNIAASGPGDVRCALTGNGEPALPRGSLRPGLARARGMAIALAVLVGSAIMVGSAPWSSWEAKVTDGKTVSTPAVLVLPFKPRGDEIYADTLAEGLTVRLIADLMKFPDFRLFTFDDTLRWGSDSDGMQDGLDSDYIVTGNVLSYGDILSVAVRLIDAADNRVLWSEVYSHPPDPKWLSGFENEISGEIAAVIAHPYGIMRTELERRIATNASDAGMHSFVCVMQAYSYRHSNQSSLYASVRACLEDAVARDPDYAEAWALLAYLRLDGTRFGYDATSGDGRDDAHTAARAAAARALALDPANVQALKALSTVEFYAGNYNESYRLARDAVNRNPNDPDALGQLGWRLSLRGNFDEGIAYLEQAVARSVRPPPWYFQPIAIERMMRGDMAGMLIAAERAEVDGSAPSAALLAIAQAGVGRNEAALATVGTMAKRWPLLGSDPARAFAIHHLDADIIAALVEGLRDAGWSP